jgi:glutamyl-tRNA synthetase
VHPSPARFDLEKLQWVNQEHIKRLSPEDLARHLRPFLELIPGVDLASGPRLTDVAVLLRDRAQTLTQMAREAEYFYGETPGVKAIQEKFAAELDSSVRAALPDLSARFESIDWTREAIGAAIKSVAAKHNLKPPQIMMAVRTLVTGTPQTPAIDAVLALMGRERTRERLQRALA